MVSEVIIHIGLEKTGTTTLQSFLSKNRSNLLSDGVYYSKAAGQSNHISLACYAANYEKKAFRDLFSIRTESDLLNFREKFRVSIGNEIKELSNSNVRKVIYSNEHCHSRITTLNEVNRLKSLFLGLAKKIKIVIYLRRQDKLAVSRFSTLLKVGAPVSSILPKLDSNNYFGAEFPYYFDFLSIYRNYASIFGEDNVCVRVFEKNKLINQDICSDFLDAINLSPSRELQRVKVTNTSLQTKALYFLSLVRNNFEHDAYRTNWSNTNIQEIASELSKEYSGQGPLPSREEAFAFYQYFKESNLGLSKELKCGDLFDTDFSFYPVTEESLTATPSDLVDIGLSLYRSEQESKL